MKSVIKKSVLKVFRAEHFPFYLSYINLVYNIFYFLTFYYI